MASCYNRRKSRLLALASKATYMVWFFIHVLHCPYHSIYNHTSGFCSQMFLNQLDFVCLFFSCFKAFHLIPTLWYVLPAPYPLKSGLNSASSEWPFLVPNQLFFFLTTVPHSMFSLYITQFVIMFVKNFFCLYPPLVP